jgi:hypothetical protein
LIGGVILRLILSALKAAIELRRAALIKRILQHVTTIHPFAVELLFFVKESFWLF